MSLGPNSELLGSCKLPEDVSAGNRVAIDLETASLADLVAGGAYRHWEHPSTRILLVGYRRNGGPYRAWWPQHQPMPADLLACVNDPSCVFVAHNSVFERLGWNSWIAPRFGCPEIPIERWDCTQARGLVQALPARLDQIDGALDLPLHKGDTSIVATMSKPRKPRGNEDPNGGPYFHDDPVLDAELQQKLEAYNQLDVDVEYELDQRLPLLSPVERLYRQLDQRINDRGIATDGGAIDHAIEAAEAAKLAIQARLQQLTGGEIETINQLERLKAHAAARGCALADFEKPTLKRALRRQDLTPEVRSILELRLEAAHAAASKAPKLREWRCLDGRIRGTHRYHGAGTGRWTSLGVQTQNFRRESENMTGKLAGVMSGDLAAMQQLGAPLEVVGDIGRALLCAAPGHRLLVGDFSGIESRILAWITDQHSKIEQWAKFDQSKNPEDDPYLILGRLLGFPEATARQYGKVADLAFGYAGGRPAWRNFAPDDDVTTDAEIDAYRQAWRDRHPRVYDFWYGKNNNIDRAAIIAVQRAPQPIKYGRLTLWCEHRHGIPFLYIQLPSGRAICYPHAKIIKKQNGYLAVWFMDNYAATGGWTEYERYGQLGARSSTFTENIVSGIARDLLAAAMLRLENAGYPIVAHVHDEVVAELPEGEGSLEEFRYLLTLLPDWASS